MIQDANHILNKLPLIITKIQVQKKDNGRYSLFNDKDFLVGISIKILTDFSIKEGVILTPSLFNQIVTAEEYEAAKSSSIRYLGQRDHASFEIRQKLKNKGFSNATIEKLIIELLQKNYLNDPEFAQKFATEKAAINKWGPKKIEIALLKKNVDRKTIQKTIKNIVENLSQEQICLDLALKRKKHFLREPDLQKRKQKIFNYLSGRGFSGSDILKYLPLITSEIDA